METENKVYTILDSQDVPTYEDYLYDMDDRGQDPEDEGCVSYEDWAELERQENYDCDLANIRYCNAYHVPVVIEGTLGLWWGHPTIEPVVCDSVYDAIMRCVGDDIDDIVAEFSDGIIIVYAKHHDGTNTFTIKALSYKGQQKDVNDGYIEEDYKKLPYLYDIGVE